MSFYAFLVIIWLIYDNLKQEQIATFKVHDEFYVSATGNIQLEIVNENTLMCTFITQNKAINIYDHSFGLSTYYNHYYVGTGCNKTIEISKGHTVKIYNCNSNMVIINCDNLLKKLHSSYNFI